jgi:hypothetical protein
MCGKFLPDYYSEEHCKKCIETLNAETYEADAGIGTGSCISGKFGTEEYCRHVVKRSSNVPKGKLRLLT